MPLANRSIRATVRSIKRTVWSFGLHCRSCNPASAALELFVPGLGAARTGPAILLRHVFPATPPRTRDRSKNSSPAIKGASTCRAGKLCCPCGCIVGTEVRVFLARLIRTAELCARCAICCARASNWFVSNRATCCGCKRHSRTDIELDSLLTD
jgi:hypothetical protein